MFYKEAVERINEMLEEYTHYKQALWIESEKLRKINLAIERAGLTKHIEAIIKEIENEETPF